MSLAIAQKAEYVGKDRWKWAVWIEGPDEELDQVDSVAWHLHPTFPNPQRWARSRADNFRLEANGWGMFEIRATLYNERGQPSGPLRHMLQLERPDSGQARMRGAAPDKPRKVFISASLGSARIVQQLRRGLEEEGFQVSDSNLEPKPGEDWRAAIEKAIRQSDAVVVVADEGVLSSFSEDEIRLAESHNKPILPVAVGGQPLPATLDRHQALHVKDGDELGGLANHIGNRLG